MSRLKGKTAIIFGGGQIDGETIGNGRATSIVFAREGAHMLIADRSLEAAEETKRQIEAEGGHAITVEADVTCEADCKAVAQTCLEAYGQIDILFNNVGISDGDSAATTLSETAWSNIMDTNLKGMFLTCKHVIPYMRERRQGAIVNMSSMMSVCPDSHVTSTSVDPGGAGSLAYKVSKAGVNALTHSLAMANAEFGIRVNAILPGLMDTPNAIEPISAARAITRETLRDERNAQVPLGNIMGTAWDVANAALFLASDEARFITGALLPVDGGQSVRIG
ncbi:MAG: SDR family oxidoreductase [Proteobacteria bacterium]|nr:MAG: SDR family oxidoreductase [Pseudomonadota bacterium]